MTYNVLMGDVKPYSLTSFISSTVDIGVLVAVWCSGNALVLINAVALHRAQLVLGWVTAFG